MVNILYDTSESFYAIGDLHGEFNDLLSMLKFNGIGNSSVVVAGDSGFGFSTIESEKMALSKLKKYVDKNNVTVYFLRGNHDNPAYFKNGVSYGKHLKCIPDYTVIVSKENEKERFRVLCVGGAISIDRQIRIENYNKNLISYMRYHRANEQKALENVNKTYWYDEAPVYEEEIIDEINKTMKIDFVVTHTCPSFCAPLTKDGILPWMERDKELENDLDSERQTMDRIAQRLFDANQPIKKWVYGHFHYHNYEVINDVEYIMLDMSRRGVCDVTEFRK